MSLCQGRLVKSEFNCVNLANTFTNCFFLQKPPPTSQAELQDVEAEEYDEEEVGYEMPNVEAEDREESPVSPMSPPAPARPKYFPPQQPLSPGKF